MHPDGLEESFTPNDQPEMVTEDISDFPKMEVAATFRLKLPVL
jgi:hypothetical protein